jgi:hypothetical protein
MSRFGSYYPGLSTLCPAPETPPEPSRNLERLAKRVELQRAALTEAEEDFRAALAKQGLWPEPDAPGPRQTAPLDTTALAQFIINAGRKRRGELPLVSAPDVDDGEREHAPTETNALAQFIINAGKRRRGELP